MPARISLLSVASEVSSLSISAATGSETASVRPSALSRWLIAKPRAWIAGGR